MCFVNDRTARISRQAAKLQEQHVEKKVNEFIENFALCGRSCNYYCWLFHGDNLLSTCRASFFIAIKNWKQALEYCE